MNSRFKQQVGFTLLETVIGVAVISTAGVAFMSGLTTAIRAESIHRDEVTGQILARNQMEYLSDRPYSGNAWSYTVTSAQRSAEQSPSWWDDGNPPLLPEDCAGYVVSAAAADFDADGDGILELAGDDAGIRRVTVRVATPEGKLLVELATNRTDR